MQTLTIEVKDDFMTEFMDVLDNFKDNIKIKKDGVPLGCKNLDQDPYFYERKKNLEQIIEECENGNMELLSQEQYDKEMDVFFKDLKTNENI